MLGSARTGLIFTRIQEGAQPGGLTQPQSGQTELGIPYHVPSCWVPVGEAVRRELTRGSGACGAGPIRNNGSVGRAVHVVFSPHLYRCCSCSLLFAVLLNCSYPDTPFSACFFPFSSAPWQGEGWPCGTFVAGGTRNENNSVCFSYYYSHYFIWVGSWTQLCETSTWDGPDWLIDHETTTCPGSKEDQQPPGLH